MSAIAARLEHFRAGTGPYAGNAPRGTARPRSSLGSPSFGRRQRYPEYRVWLGMRSRCEKPAAHGYSGYGGRGIRVCAEWRGDEGFDSFYAHVGPRPTSNHTLGRIDNDRGYEPGNVRWETWSEQANNRRGNLLITIDGVTRTAAEWARAAGNGLCRQNVANRIRSGWHPSVAAQAPPGEERSIAHARLGIEPVRKASRREKMLPAEVDISTPVRRNAKCRAVSP